MAHIMGTPSWTVADTTTCYSTAVDTMRGLGLYCDKHLEPPVRDDIQLGTQITM